MCSIIFSNIKILQEITEFSSAWRNPSNSSRRPLKQTKDRGDPGTSHANSSHLPSKTSKILSKMTKEETERWFQQSKLENYFFLPFSITSKKKLSVELLFSKAHEHEHEQKRTSVGVEPWDLRASGEHVSPCDYTLRRYFQLSFPYDNSFAISMIIDSVRREPSQVSNVLDTFSGIKRHLGRHFLFKSISRLETHPWRNKTGARC